MKLTFSDILCALFVVLALVVAIIAALKYPNAIP